MHAHDPADDLLALHEEAEILFRQEPAEGPALPPEVTRRLGELLRAFYVGLQMEPIPERLLRILDPLDQHGRNRRGH